jgi:ribosomal protein S12 methylthiotransferase
MRRGTTEQKTYELIDRIRDRVPGIAIRTTLITGYPGETEKDHEAMLRFVERVRFDRLGVFAYSHEENTHAYRLEDDIPAEVKQERSEAVMAIQQGVSEEINSSRVGQVMKVLFDRKEGDYFIGRTEFDSPEVDNEVLLPARDSYVRIGGFADVRITSAEAFDLYAEPVS